MFIHELKRRIIMRKKLTLLVTATFAMLSVLMLEKTQGMEEETQKIGNKVRINSSPC